TSRQTRYTMCGPTQCAPTTSAAIETLSRHGALAGDPPLPQGFDSMSTTGDWGVVGHRLYRAVVVVAVLAGVAGSGAACWSRPARKPPAGPAPSVLLWSRGGMQPVGQPFAVDGVAVGAVTE